MQEQLEQEQQQWRTMMLNHQAQVRWLAWGSCICVSSSLCALQPACVRVAGTCTNSMKFKHPCVASCWEDDVTLCMQSLQVNHMETNMGMLKAEVAQKEQLVQHIAALRQHHEDAMAAKDQEMEVRYLPLNR